MVRDGKRAPEKDAMMERGSAGEHAVQIASRRVDDVMIQTETETETDTELLTRSIGAAGEIGTGRQIQNTEEMLHQVGGRNPEMGKVVLHK